MSHALLPEFSVGVLCSDISFCCSLAHVLGSHTAAVVELVQHVFTMLPCCFSGKPSGLSPGGWWRRFTRVWFAVRVGIYLLGSPQVFCLFIICLWATSNK